MTPGRGGLNDSDSADGDYQNKKQYPDENQVFVGNLPQNIVEEDLRTLFARFGRILDVRINRQNQNKSSNVKTPNYGFVTFETQDIVHTILKQKVLNVCKKFKFIIKSFMIIIIELTANLFR
jgi:RNA recognition motif-containing protein